MIHSVEAGGAVFNEILALQLTSGPIPIASVAVGALVALWLLVRRPVSRWFPRSVAVAALGAGLGYLGAWVLGDLLDLFGASPSFVTRSWFAFSLAGVAMAVLRSVTARRTRRANRWLAAACVPLFVLVGAVGINADIGEFPTVAAIAGVGYDSIVLPAVSAPDPTGDPSGGGVTVAPAAEGRVGSVTIPATVSGFGARDAMVYLPPAALVPNPPKLPVLIMMSGQPGSPAQLFRSGKLATLLDNYAGEHGGLAPIVVAPDQLGASDHNPMCVDSPLGNSATYITVDVPQWIRTHLNVLDNRADWAVGGFSQGGTCAIQFGAGYPQLFGNILDIAGELAPHNGSVQNTINLAFGGSDAAYQAATPVALLAAHAPLSDTLGVFVAGSLDSRFGPGLRTVVAAAEKAGVNTHSLTSPGTGHDWYTVGYGFSQGLDLFGTRWGFGA